MAWFNKLSKLALKIVVMTRELLISRFSITTTAEPNFLWNINNIHVIINIPC
ncbi:hypothetical protein RI030_05285 [Aphanizomenon flos-aquae NRERC-008]|jgi:hypothetical protein|uniref:hypothetical protein n=1 Tax=Aphanizomenon TaxID=1175 RepID=UPI001684A9A4|nr:MULTISPECIES: hypothetical protein [Aphanizomenon]MBD2632875.1 hypothetical protein [Aphanizomenon sp. FACHB-1399]MBD2672445.1 hypothetical protein [Aphanizomenon flos-aquae FACHB-1416]MBO1043341.1 hypothetical protein [Aphanizomenon flos-aquae UKL13-PB]MBO1060652.1 hypothetical protein [Aphanizomenon flos-aquae CP01]NTW19026.1 hypothetical protein [Nostocales cyanobacterium W4_Combined_metabat2_030]QSV67188.1 MAG: hypothetical protein HEQ12_09725 [Aphanizomenon flos-aquae DEX188]